MAGYQQPTANSGGPITSQDIELLAPKQNPGESYDQYRQRQLSVLLGRPATSADLTAMGSIGIIPYLNQVLTKDQIQANVKTGYDQATQDYAKQQLALNPSSGLDANTTASQASQIASDLIAHGINPLKDPEAAATFTADATVQNNIDRALNPQKYLSQDKNTANQQTAQQLIAQVYGSDQAQDPHLVDYISQQLAQGIHPYELSQLLQTTPQYLEAKAAKDREAINQELLSSEDQVFNQAAPQIISQYMKAGRLNSSGLNSSLANARAQLAQQRQGVLAGYAREDAVNARDTAFQNYLRQSQPGYQQKLDTASAQSNLNYGVPFQNLNRQYQLNDQATQRQYQLEDYSRQQSDYFRALDQQRRAQQQALPYQIFGSVLGAGLSGWASGGFKH
jgi:hypothetical protein